MATSSPATTTSAPSTPDAGRDRSESAAPSAKRIKTEHSAAPSPLSTTVRQNDFAPRPSLPPVPSSAAVNSTSHYRTAVPSQLQQQRQQQQQQPEQRDNLESLVDVMGSSGIDLRAEEEAIQRRGGQLRANPNNNHARSGQTSNSSYDDELYLQVYPLAYKVHTIAQKHGLSVDAAVLNYLSLAARMRIKNLLETMVASSRHRSWSSHQHPPPMFPDSNTPMYHEQISSNPTRQLAALEKAERGDEARRRKQRLARDTEASALASGSGAGLDGELDGMGDDGTGTPRSGALGNKKPKKIGPGVAARNMSEDVRKRLADSTAMRNLGGGSSKYSWLSGGNTGAGPSAFGSLGGKKADAAADGGGSRLPKPKFAPQPPVNGTQTEGWGSSGDASANRNNASNTASAGAWGDVAARQAAKLEEERQARLRVTLRDALFALEYERRGGAGHGSGESLLYRLRARANPNTQG